MTVDGPPLAAAVRKVARAASEHEIPLRGVLLDLGGSAITAVATDRYWLASWTVPVAEAQTPDRRAFLPLDCLEELASRLDHHDLVTVEFGAGRVTLSDDAETVPIPTADDRFPAYRLIVPGPELRTGRVTFDRTSLAALLSSPRNTADDTADDTPVRLAVGADRLGVNRLGESERTRISAATSGASTTLWFAAGVLRRALDTMVGSTVSLVYSAPNRAVQLSPVEQSQLGILLMPSQPQS